MSYWRFAAMILTSTVVMLGLMYLNTYEVEHVFWSETRAWMAVLMGAAMAVIMLAFMLGMYDNRALNLAIFAGSAAVFALSLWLVRSQETVQDESWMSAMIPHHSIAIMTSSRAELTDPRVQALAEGIVYAQDKEIAEMRWLMADIAANGEAASAPAAPAAAVVPAGEALSTEVVGQVDPEFLTPDDIATGLPDGAACRFTYTGESPPVLVTGATGALVRISGDLVRLEGGADAAGGTFGAAPLQVELRAVEDGYADLLVSAGPDYEAGFRGHWSCAG